MADWSKDFQEFWETVRDNYAYWPDAPCDWNAVKRAYATELPAVKDKVGFIRLLERAIGELCDGHASLGTNLSDSLRLVPSGTDVWVEARHDGVYVTDLRRDVPGLAIGTRVLGIGGLPLDAALKSVWPKTVKPGNLPAKTYWANALVAGRHDAPRRIRTENGEISLRPIERKEAGTIQFGWHGKIAYIRPLDSLGNNALIADFDRAMASILASDGLVLDLTNTPSGGNTTVARAILGWFVTGDSPYQKHEDPAEEKWFGVRRFWTEWVAPRAGKSYRRPTIVLVNRWTGSMGEGIAIALQGMRRARLLGTPMAGLKGAVSRFDLPESKIPFYLPTERLFRIDGMPREKCLPDVSVGWQPGRQAALQRAVSLLRRGNKP